MSRNTWNLILQAFKKNGGKKYMISEPITQLQHSLQTYAWLNSERCNRKLRVAGLLHDIGHLFYKKPVDPRLGINDKHEIVGGMWLMNNGFSREVYFPIMNHVDAKRYLCGKNPEYYELLSTGSKLSLELQGGAMSKQEQNIFEDVPFFKETLLLRDADDNAKSIGVTNLPQLEELEYEVLSAIENENKNENTLRL